ncbi:MAG: hypothetical protein ACYSSN_12550, partial [Planctomycetota bacterium]
MNVMQNKSALFLIILITSIVFASTNCIAGQKVAIIYDQQDPRMAFATGEIKRALLNKNYEIGADDADIRIVFDIFQAGMGPQSFRIRREGSNTIRIVGGNSLGAMYGGLEVAEMVTLGGDLKDIQEKA